MTTSTLPSKSPFGRIVLDGERHRSWCDLWAAWHNPLVSSGTRCTCGELTVEDTVAWWALQARQAMTSDVCSQCGRPNPGHWCDSCGWQR